MRREDGDICGHDWVPDSHFAYVRCTRCGTYLSTRARDPREVYAADYWSHARGHSTLEEQAHNVSGHREGGKTKQEFVLELLGEPVGRASVLEIGCAPGTLLRALAERFWFAGGIEACEAWESELQAAAGSRARLTFGLFPECTQRWLTRWDVIVALDVFEHVPDPAAFLRECARLLAPGGRLLLMSPIICPGVEMPDRMWAPEEHIWLHSAWHVNELLRAEGFVGVQIRRWCAGHEIVTARRAM